MTKYEKMTGTPIGRLTISLAIPTIISMLVSAIYNMADTYFVTKIGTSASGAVGVVFSIMTIIQAVGFTLGMGSGTWIGRLLGAQEEKEASRVAATGFYSALVLGSFLTVFGLLLINPLMRVLGATDTILPYAKDYARFILLAAPFMCASFVMNNLLRFEGMARFAMVGIATGGILNMVLDPIFIFGFKLGIAGAAIATGLSQCVSFLLLLGCFLRRKTVVRLSLSNASRDIKTYFQIINNGLASFCRQGMASIANISLNLAAGVYGDPAIAAMSIVGKVMWVMFSVIIGFGQGYQPVLGFNYGAKRFDRAKEAFFFMLKSCTCIGILFAACGYLAAPMLIRHMIGYDAQAVEIGIFALRAQVLMFPLIPTGVTCNMSYQSIGKSWTATFLSALRQGICFLPAIFILPVFLGVRGVQLAQPAADLCTFLVAAPSAFCFYRFLTKRMAEEGREGPEEIREQTV